MKAITNNGHLIFGITEGNVERLKAGNPILIRLSEMGLGDKSIVIMYGKDNKELEEMMVKEELITERTKVYGTKPSDSK